jgi:cyclophilin family peptidyl-prolyl cis-trans isomerase
MVGLSLMLAGTGLARENDKMEEAAPEAAPEMKTEKESDMVIIKTTLGDIKVKLAEDKAPLSVANFLSYVDAGHYNGTVFHRVIDGFMIQGGGFDKEMRQKTTKAPIKNEAANGLRNKRGTLAMARTMVVDSATSQFFINVKDNGFLDFRSPDPQGFGYAVFGEVVEGMDVVDKIKGVRTGFKAGMQDVPLETVEIISIERAE